jgi:ribose-phosphate pyrophosphokinase
LKPKTPVIFTFHCQDYYHKKWGAFARAYLKFGERIGCRYADKVVVISPDAGGVARAREVAKKLGAKLAIIDKRRDKPNESEVLHIVGDVKGFYGLIVDDMIDTAGTLVHAVNAVMGSGALGVTAVAAHGVLSGPAYERIGGCTALKHVVVTDSIPKRSLPPSGSADFLTGYNKVSQVSIASLIGESIRRINNGESISALFT